MVLSGAITEWAPLLRRLDYSLVPVCNALATGKASYMFVVTLRDRESGGHGELLVLEAKWEHPMKPLDEE